MGDMGDVWNALKDQRRELRAKYGIDCPQCKIVRPKANPSLLLPQQRCKIDGYTDPRERYAVTKERDDLKRLVVESLVVIKGLEKERDIALAANKIIGAALKLS
jgi:hypothetical protein